jgi:Zn-dependent protease
VGAVFLSILVHEMGHALMYRWYGSRGRVWLYWFGGLAAQSDMQFWGWRQVAVSLAGPVAGFLLAGVVYLSSFFFDWTTTFYLMMMYFYLMTINIYWGIINLLPVYPLDGGQALRGVLEARNVERSMEVTLQVTVVTGSVVAIWSLMNFVGQPRELLLLAPSWTRITSPFLGLLFGALAYAAYLQLQAFRRSDPWS